MDLKHSLLALLVVLIAVGHGSAHDQAYQRTDTLIIELGNNSKMIIFVDSQKDLKSLQEFDINEMIREINESIESADENGVIEITDDSGERFLKDSLKTVEQPKPVVSPPTPAPAPSPVNPRSEYVPPRVVDLANLAQGDTIQAVLANGETVRLTFSENEEEKNDYVDRSERRWKQDYRTSRLSRNFFAVDFGLNNWMTDGQLPSGEDNLHAIKPIGSWYVGGRYARRVAIGGPVFIEFGGSATWYSWKFENKNVRIVKDPSEVNFTEDLTISGVKSKLSATYVNFEVMPTLDFSYGKERVDDPEERRRRYTRHIRPNGLKIGIGGYAGYRLDSWTKNVYKDANGEEKKDTEGSTFHLNNLRYGARVMIELDYDFSIFCNYDLNTVFVKDKGPELNAISFGVTLEL